MATKNKHQDELVTYSPGDLITYMPDGTVRRIVNMFETRPPIVGEVVSDIDGVVTYTERLPAPVIRKVAAGRTATPGRSAVAGGPDGLADGPWPGAGSASHFAEGFWAEGGSDGDEVLMHPCPHWYVGADVE